MGLEGEESSYDKLHGIDTRELVKELQANGIRVLGSSIIGLEDHRPENMDKIIDYAVSHDTVFHQFMLYTPVAGTPLYEKHRQDGTLLPESEMPVPTRTGNTGSITATSTSGTGRRSSSCSRRSGGTSGQRAESAENDTGPAQRLAALQGAAPERVRDRVAWEVSPLRSTYAGAVWAIRHWYGGNPRIAAKADELLRDIYEEFGWKTRLAAPMIGRFVAVSLRREEKRLAAGWQYEPTCFVEKNAAALALEQPPSTVRVEKKEQRRPWRADEPVPVPVRESVSS